MKMLRASWFFGRWCLGCLRDFSLLLLWIVLSAALLLQLIAVTSHQLPLPSWLLRKIEARVEAGGLRLQIGDATMDPAGHVLIRDIELRPQGFDDPVARIDKVYVRLNPFALFHGHVRPQYVHVNGLNLQLPAIFSPTGKTEPVVSDIRFSLRQNGGTLGIDDVSGRLANLTFAARGALALPALFGSNPSKPSIQPAQVAAWMRRYNEIARQIIENSTTLASFERPHLDCDISNNKDRLNLHLVFTSEKARLDLSDRAPQIGVTQVEKLSAGTHLDLGPDWLREIQIDFSARSLRCSTGISATDLSASYRGPISNTEFADKAAYLYLCASSCAAAGIDVEHPSVVVRRSPAGVVHGEVFGVALETPWGVEADVVPAIGQGYVTIDGAITNPAVRLLAARIDRPAERLLTLRDPAPIHAAVELFADWKLGRIEGRLKTGPIVAASVPFRSLEGTVKYEGSELTVSDITATQAENFAHGVYWMNTSTKDFRFLLSGQLRPIQISAFFEDWWSHFWNNFDFAPAPPKADVAVNGRWGAPHLCDVFVNVDATRPTVRGVFFDHINTTLFIRPDYYHALELRVSRQDHIARGSFVRAVDLYKDTDDLRYMDFDFVSNLDLSETARLFGKEGVDTVAPFLFGTPPSMRISGHVDGPASPKGFHRHIQLGVKSTGDFYLYNFPLKELTFHGTIDDDVIDLPSIQVDFARGHAVGSATMSGPEDARQLRFDCKLSDALVGEAISTLEQYSAKERGEAPPEQSKFQQQVADGRLNLQLAAQGNYSDLFSFYGHGYMEISGAQLAQINLLGALSQVLSKNPLFKFTSLQLNEAKTSFVLERDRITMPDLKISGSSAVIDAKGYYALDKKAIEFDAKVYPFSQGKTLLANAVGFVLVPLSNALELKLSGTLEKPNWRLAYGPTSFLYNVTGTKPGEDEKNKPSSTSNGPSLTPYQKR